MRYIEKNLPSQRQAIYESLVLSHLTGRYKAQREADVKRTSPLAPLQRGEGFAEYDLPDILSRALDWFRAKKVITKLKFLKLSAEMRWKSFTVAKVSDKKILSEIKDRMTEAIETGIGIDDFRKDIDLLFDRVGVSRLNPFHLDTVYLTNSMSGYGEGRKQLIDELDVDEFPLRQVITAEDDRVRTPHARLHEFTAPKDDPVWNWLKTPFSYRCRCDIVPVHISEGLSPSSSLPDIRGEKGFEFLSVGSYGGGAMPEVEKIKTKTAKTITSDDLKRDILKTFDIKKNEIDKLNNVESLGIIKNQLLKLKKEGYNFNYKFIDTDIKGNEFASSSKLVLSLNKKWFNDIKSFQNNLDKGIKTGWIPKECNKIECIITHEFGHSLSRDALDFKFTPAKEFSKIKSEYSRALSKYRENRKEWENIYISEYAKKNIHEFVADSFMMYKHSKNPSPFAIRIGELIDKYFKSKNK